MSKPTTKRPAVEGPSYRQRAAQARAAAGQPQPASLPCETVAESRAEAFQADAAPTQDPGRGHPEESGRAGAAGGSAPRREQDMGRHETFENAAPIAQELLAGTALVPPEGGSVRATASDRLALINYATWLFMERRLVCRELYPHMGAEAAMFVAANTAADLFHFPADHRSWQDVPPPSTRAVQILDQVGVDWRRDAVYRNDLDPPSHGEVERPQPPHGWPALDGALMTALVDLRRVDAAIEALIAHLPADRDPETLPGYDELQDARGDVLHTLTATRADALPGLQAKAKALLADSLRGDPDTIEALAHSLARDLIGRRHGDFALRADPVLPAIEESRRLYAAWVATNDLPETPGTLDRPPEAEAAKDAFCAHVADVLLKAAPTTARGCAALARYAVEFEADHGFTIDQDEHGIDHLRVLDLIARSPLF